MKNIGCAALMLACLFVSRAHGGEIWKQFLEARRTPGATAILPDFSYAGYERGETDIPDVAYRSFDVTDYGAIPNDDAGDEDGIRAAIRAAEKHGEGIVFFPKGTYLVSTGGNQARHVFVIRKSRIVLRGEGAEPGGTVIFMRDWLGGLTEGPSSSPYLFQFRPDEAPGQGIGAVGERITALAGGPVARGAFWIEVASAAGLSAGQWIQLKLGPDGKFYGYIDPYEPEDFMTHGVDFEEKHQIERIEGHRIKLREPLQTDADPSHPWEVWTYPHLQGVGVEDILFRGNWHDVFDHHLDARHDGGYSAVRMDNCVHSWVRRCRFEDWNRSLCFWDSSFSSVLDVKVAGKEAHHGVRACGGYGMFLGAAKVTQPNHHGPSVGYGSAGTVFWRYEYSGDRGMDAHGNTGYATLLDHSRGGMARRSNGGGQAVLPNHLRHLVWWNLMNTGPEQTGWDAWKLRPFYVKPIVVGLHGALMTFKDNNEQLELNESPGRPVTPESLYEAQLELRLGTLPGWVKDLKREPKETHR